MDFIIHAYGYGETIKNTLNSLAMLRNSALYPAIINTMALMVGVFYAWQMAAAKADGEWRQYLKKVFGMIILINVLLLPKATMHVKDHVEKNFWSVDNIPLAFALPIGHLESLGNLITMGFEQAFNQIDGKAAFAYYHHGNVFGARLSKELMNVKIRDPEVVSNMHNFIDRCIRLPARRGYKFTAAELEVTNDVWEIVSKKAGSFTRVPMTIRGVRQNPSWTCKQSVPYFEKALNDEMNYHIFNLSSQFKGAGSEQAYNAGSKKLNANIKEQIRVLYDSKTSVDSILKQNMMVNAMQDFKSGEYALAKARMQYEANAFISADMAERILPILLSVVKNILYGSFIFVIPLMIVSGGMGKYRDWITMCLSLQLWPALLAMLNMIIDYASDPIKIVSYSSWSTDIVKYDSMMSVACGLTFTIPVAAIMLTRMGEGGLMHLSGSIMSAASGASMSAASEKASGNMSWDNESINNKNYNNVSANKYDDTQQYVTGVNSSISSDGSMEKIMPNGEVVSIGGAGTTSSSGEASYHESEGISTALQEGKRHEEQALSSSQVSFAKAKESLISEEVSALKTISENTRTDQGYNIDTSTEEGQEVVKALNTIDRMSQSNDYGWEQNAETHLKADISGVGPANKIAKFLGFEASVGGSVNAINSSNQTDGEYSDISSETQNHDRLSNSNRATKNEAYLESIGIDKMQQESIRESYNKTSRLEEAVSMHQDKIDSYTQTLDHTQSSGNEYSKDVYQEVVNKYKDKYGVSDSEAGREVGEGTFAAKEIFREISATKADKMLHSIRVNNDKLSDSSHLHNFADQYSGKVKENTGIEVDGFARNQGMRDANIIEIDTTRSKDNIEAKYADMTNEADGSIQSNKEVALEQREEREGIITHYDHNRLGKHLIGRPINENIERDIQNINRQDVGNTKK